jgi:hypothetical protein
MAKHGKSHSLGSTDDHAAATVSELNALITGADLVAAGAVLPAGRVVLGNDSTELTTDGNLAWNTSVLSVGGGIEAVTGIDLKADSVDIAVGGQSDFGMSYDGTDGILDSSIVAASDIIMKCGSQKTLELETPVYRDWNFNVSMLGRTNGTRPDLINLSSSNIEVAAFAGNALEEVSGVIELNHEWAEGTDITPHIHWYPTTTDTGDVVWKMEYEIVGLDETAGAGTVITAPATAAGGTAWVQKLTNWAVISGTSLNIGDQLHFRLYRDPVGEAGDTYGADAAAATLGFHYQLNTMGSRLISTK